MFDTRDFSLITGSALSTVPG